MPLYEYECEKCGEIEEVLQKFSDKPLIKCKHCSGNLHKLVSHSSFHLKGTGWYVTDYANKSQHNSSEKSGKKKTVSKTEKTKKSKKSSDKIL
ncbi:MAG: zinc ribbon domain-containing protein [Desulfosarcina sp.]|nr:zinc ribbon domain-containing protein [Desulfobacterales bacterium]